MNTKKSSEAKRYNHRLNIHLDDGMMQVIQAEAQKMGLNVASFVRMILKSELFLRTQKKPKRS